MIKKKNEEEWRRMKKERWWSIVYNHLQFICTWQTISFDWSPPLNCSQKVYKSLEMKDLGEMRRGEREKELKGKTIFKRGCDNLVVVKWDRSEIEIR